MTTQMSELRVLTREEKEKLVRAALTVKDLSYSPYSKFPVGAALLTDDGEIITGMRCLGTTEST